MVFSARGSGQTRAMNVFWSVVKAMCRRCATSDMTSATMSSIICRVNNARPTLIDAVCHLPISLVSHHHHHHHRRHRCHVRLHCISTQHFCRITLKSTGIYYRVVQKKIAQTLMHLSHCKLNNHFFNNTAFFIL